jgi:hypothetical protein
MARIRWRTAQHIDTWPRGFGAASATPSAVEPSHGEHDTNHRPRSRVEAAKSGLTWTNGGNRIYVGRRPCPLLHCSFPCFKATFPGPPHDILNLLSRPALQSAAPHHRLENRARTDRPGPVAAAHHAGELAARRAASHQGLRRWHPPSALPPLFAPPPSGDLLLPRLYPTTRNSQARWPFAARGAPAPLGSRRPKTHQGRAGHRRAASPPPRCSQPHPTTCPLLPAPDCNACGSGAAAPTLTLAPGPGKMCYVRSQHLRWAHSGARIGATRARPGPPGRRAADKPPCL